MGREKVIAYIKKSSIKYAILIGATAVICLLIAIFVTDMVMQLRLLVFLLTGFLSWGTVRFCGCFKDPRKSTPYRENPLIYELADEHFATVIYEDKFVTISQRMVSCTKNPTKIAFLNEVYMLHISKTSMNFIPTSKELIISHARGIVSLNIYGASKSTINVLFQRLIPLCPNAAVGYSRENLNYLGHMRMQWKNTVGAAIRQANVQQNMPMNMQPNVQQNMPMNMQPYVQPGMPMNMQPNVQPGMPINMQANVQQNMPMNMQPNIQPGADNQPQSEVPAADIKGEVR